MTWIDAATVARLEARFGRPREVAIVQEVGPEIFAPFEASLAKKRRHDVTLFIRDARGLFAVTRKPSYPPGVFRPPSGGIEPGEEFEAGARREAREETGLEVALERYVVRVRATFVFGPRLGGRGAAERSEALPLRSKGARPVLRREEGWTSHVFLARAAAGALAPIDTREIAEARWASADEMRGPIVAGLRASGSRWLAYRAELQEAAMAAIDGLAGNA